MSAVSWLGEYGEPGKRILETDWSKTGAGPIETWPRELVNAVRQCLGSGLPATVAWGEDCTQICNEAYEGIFRGTVQASDFREAWKWAWPAIARGFERAWLGEPSHVEDSNTILDRTGSADTAYLTCSFTPIMDGTGRVRGVIHTIVELTHEPIARTLWRDANQDGSSGRPQSFDDESRARAPDQSSRHAAAFLARWKADEAVRISEQQFKAMADAAPAILWITAPDGSCTFLSRSWYEFTGQTPAEALGFGWTDAVHPEDRDTSARTFLAANEARQAFSLDHRLRRSDGAYRWVIDAGRPWFNDAGEFLGFSGSVIDVHERKQAERALRDADRRKDEFLALLAHELRNPLAPLRNALQLLRVESADRTVHDHAHSIMDRQLGLLVRLVDDLLDVSRIGRDVIVLSMKTVDVIAVLEHAIEINRPHIEQAGHLLSIQQPELPVHVSGDAMRLTQVFSNVLHNAAKYTDNGGRIDVVVEHTDEHVSVAVRDTGIGISPDVLPHVFDMFTQADRSLERTRGGLGIGLSLVRKLVEKHGGTVEASSDGLGHGSEFVIRLPLTHEDHAS